MRQFLFVIASLAFLASCSVKTNEEKARELIEPQVKSHLIKPETYEFAEIKIDSCFSDDIEHNPDVFVFSLKVAKIYKEYKKYMSEAELAESSMTIYASSYGYQDAHSKQQEKKYKAEMEKAKRKAETAKEEILNLYKDNRKFINGLKEGKHEFLGWMVAFGYRAETSGGMKRMSGVLCYLNKDLTEVNYLFSEEDLETVQDPEIDDLQYEFEDELKEIFEKD